MDTNFDEPMQYFFMANKHSEPHNAVTGDFANSEELKQYLQKIMEMKEQFCDRLGLNPFSQQIREVAKEVTSPAQKESAQAQATTSQALNSGPASASHLFKKQVLMEPCTVNTPLNISLREKFSKQNFYFLLKG